MVLIDMSRIITKLTNGSKSYEIVTSFINSTYTISLFCVNKGHISANPDKVETGHARIKGKKNVLAVYVLAIKNLYYFNEDREKAIDLFFKYQQRY